MNQNLMGVLGIAVTMIFGWLAHRITKPKDAERAATIEKIAQGVVALLVVAWPKASWTDLIQKAIDAMIAAGAPSTNKAALERAAAAALTELGKNPEVAKGAGP